jgi:hypothetical protein
MLEVQSRLTPPAPKVWEFQERRASGIFIVSRSGALLCRVEPPFNIFLWDKKSSQEICIDVRDLPLYPFVNTIDNLSQ